MSRIAFFLPDAVRCGTATRLLIGSAAFLAVLLLLLRVLVHYPIVDEINHAHYLWLISEGLKPGADFFCNYPPLFYLFLVPVFRWFPESAFVLLVLRFLSVSLAVLAGWILYRHGLRATGDRVSSLIPPISLAASTNIGPFLAEFSIDWAAALAAAGAMALFFLPPRPCRVAWASALCLLSAAITPKYAMPLVFGLAGYLVSGFLAGGGVRKVLVAAGGGMAASLALVAGYYLAYGIPVAAIVKSSFVLNPLLSTSRGDDLLANEILRRLFLSQPLLGAVTVLGLGGWLKRSRRRVDHVTLGGAGLLFGCILFSFMIREPHEQYQMPIYLAAAMFAPFAMALVPARPTLLRCVRLLLAAAAAAAVILSFPAVAGEFAKTSVGRRDTANTTPTMGPPAVAYLGHTDFLLQIIPRDERVAAVWFHHPIFRRDATGMTTDDRPSLSGYLADGDPLKRFFDPAYYLAEIEARPPALIDPNRMQVHYPPGWQRITFEFLERNRDLYVAVPSRVLPDAGFYIRRDLIKTAMEEDETGRDDDRP
jgi:hypothetical protein